MDKLGIELNRFADFVEQNPDVSNSSPAIGSFIDTLKLNDFNLCGNISSTTPSEIGDIEPSEDIINLTNMSVVEGEGNDLQEIPKFYIIEGDSNKQLTMDVSDNERGEAIAGPGSDVITSINMLMGEDNVQQMYLVDTEGRTLAVFGGSQVLQPDGTISQTILVTNSTETAEDEPCSNNDEAEKIQPGLLEAQFKEITAEIEKMDVQKSSKETNAEVNGNGENFCTLKGWGPASAGQLLIEPVGPGSPMKSHQADSSQKTPLKRTRRTRNSGSKSPVLSNTQPVKKSARANSSKTLPRKCRPRKKSALVTEPKKVKVPEPRKVVETPDQNKNPDLEPIIQKHKLFVSRLNAVQSSASVTDTNADKSSTLWSSLLKKPVFPMTVTAPKEVPANNKEPDQMTDEELAAEGDRLMQEKAILQMMFEITRNRHAEVVAKNKELRAAAEKAGLGNVLRATGLDKLPEPITTISGSGESGFTAWRTNIPYNNRVDVSAGRLHEKYQNI